MLHIERNETTQMAAYAPGDHETIQAPAARRVWPAMLAGMRHRCPNCGTGNLYARYLKVADSCPHCGEELHHQKADDGPPYFTILIVGHFLVGAILAVERHYAPPMWLQMCIWLPLALILSLALLPRVKGAIVGLQWALRMHGFDTAVRNGAPDTALGHGLTAAPNFEQIKA